VKQPSPNGIVPVVRAHKSRFVITIRPFLFVAWIAFALVCYGQPQPDVTAQRDAMKKLDFLVGKWSGEASVMRGPGEP
jgi:hypothetical protein